jgi:hypothetical protein
MIEELGPAGMSSDESEVDEVTKKSTYTIRTRAWRSREVLNRVKTVDKDNNTTNAYGGARPGNRPRERRRMPGAISKRAPVAKCPSNFYAPEFVSNLGNRERKLLWMLEAQDLGTVEGIEG